MFPNIWSWSRRAKAPKALEASLGSFRRHPSFQSRFLPARDVVVWLPPGYEEDEDRCYPVLYLQDGQNLFDRRESAVGRSWQLHQTAARLIRRGTIEPLLLVGIHNSGKGRHAEYTPAADPHHGGGEGELYARFLCEEVKPVVDALYRTLPGVRHTGLGGSSLGGLAALHVGLARPHVFGALAVHSPAVWWANRAVIRNIEALSVKPAVRLWVDIGTREGGSSLADARLLREALRAKGWRLGEDLAYREDRGARHTEDAWGRRAAMMLRFLFGVSRDLRQRSWLTWPWRNTAASLGDRDCSRQL